MAKYGLLGRPTRRTKFYEATISERFFSKINPNPTDKGCWEWMASCKNYREGQLNFGGKFYGAHRLSYEIHKGKIPDGMHVCHSCDNPKCVNPAHLWLGTHQDNMKDRMLKKRGNTAKGEKAGMSKLTKVQVKEIRYKYEKGVTQTALGREYNVTQAAIWYIVKKRVWNEANL